MEDRRRTLRIAPERELNVTLAGNRPARLVDISADGAHLELASALHPSHVCRVSVPLPDGNVKLKARVAHCKLLARGPSGPDGGLVYRAGLEFLDVDLAVVDAINATFFPVPSKSRRRGPIKVRVDVAALEREQHGDHEKHGTN